MSNKCVDVQSVKGLLVLPRELVPDSIIRIRGYVPLKPKQFEVNLQRGPGLRDADIMLHMAARFSENVVVRNHYVPGQGWNLEERDGGVPFKAGTNFELEFKVEEDLVRITVDGKLFTSYNHRLPLDVITHVRVDNDVNIYHIGFEPQTTSCTH